MEGSVAAVKKAFCFFLAIVFIGCVMLSGTNNRYSVSVMLENLTNFEDMPTIEDVLECWTADSYVVEVTMDDYPLVFPYYPSQALDALNYKPTVDPATYEPLYLHIAYRQERDKVILDVPEGAYMEWNPIWTPYPVEYDSEGNVTAWDWASSEYIYFDDGTQFQLSVVDYMGQPLAPFIYSVESRQEIFYEDYDGDDAILQFFSGIKGFFNRVWRCIKLIVDMLFSAISNVKYFLPWNSTVPREV